MMPHLTTPSEVHYPPELANPVSERVQIRNIGIIESHAKRAGDERFESASLVLRHEANPLEVVRHPNAISVKISFLLYTLRDGAIEADPALFIHAVFVLVYSITSLEGIEDVNLGAFAATNGVYNAWPYWREFVQSTTVRMGLPAVVAPVFRVPAASPPTFPEAEG